MLTSMLLSSILLSGAGDPNYSYVTNCSERGLGCKLTTFEIPGTQLEEKDINATFKISYRFPCGNTTQNLPSKLIFSARLDNIRPAAIRYQGSETVSVDGPGPVRVIETDASAGNSELGSVYQSSRCGLYVDKVEVAPSDTQIAIWAVQRTGAISNLNSIQKIYNNRKTVQFWATMYSNNPDSFRPIIQRMIDKLQSKADAGDPWALVDLIQYQAILSDAPDQEIAEAFKSIEATALLTIGDAEKMERIRQKMGLSADTELVNLISQTRTVMENNR